jgi:hypothetical protein
MATVIVATEELRNTVSQVPPFSPDQITAMVKQRTTVDATELASYTRTLIGTKMRDVFVARPLLKEVKRRFKILPREKQVDGTYLEIDGATSFEKWCEKHEKFIGSSRNAYYILNGGNKNRKPSATRGAAWHSARRGAPWAKIDGGATVLEAFSTVQKDIRRCAAPGDSYEREAIDFTKRLYFFGWEIWKRLLIIASEDIGLADISVSKEVSRLWEVSKTVKDAKHSDLLMLVEAVAICCRAKKSRAMDNAINCKQTWTASSTLSKTGCCRSSRRSANVPMSKHRVTISRRIGLDPWVVFCRTETQLECTSRCFVWDMVGYSVSGARCLRDTTEYAKSSGRLRSTPQPKKSYSATATFSPSSAERPSIQCSPSHRTQDS